MRRIVLSLLPSAYVIGFGVWDYLHRGKAVVLGVGILGLMAVVRALVSPPARVSGGEELNMVDLTPTPRTPG